MCTYEYVLKASDLHKAPRQMIRKSPANRACLTISRQTGRAGPAGWPWQRSHCWGCWRKTAEADQSQSCLHAWRRTNETGEEFLIRMETELQKKKKKETTTPALLLWQELLMWVRRDVGQECLERGSKKKKKSLKSKFWTLESRIYFNQAQALVIDCAEASAGQMLLIL